MRKTSAKSKFSAVVMGFMAAVLVIFSKETILQVKAAEDMLVTNLEVAAAPDAAGVMAGCHYQNYTDQSGCEMRLYLYRVEGGKEIVESQTPLSFATQGYDCTQPKQVPDGIYRASVTIDDGIEIRQVNSLNFYQVGWNGNVYIVTEITGGKGKEQSEPEKEDQRKSDSCGHYACDYFLIGPATSEKDAVQAYQCIDCGAVLEYKDVPNSAYAAFLKETEEMIQNASHQAEIIISTEQWMSFDRAVFDALKIRQDIMVKVNYRYQGEIYLLVIPAGIDVEKLIDENGFAGFRRIEEILTGGAYFI